MAAPPLLRMTHDAFYLFVQHSTIHYVLYLLYVIVISLPDSLTILVVLNYMFVHMHIDSHVALKTCVTGTST